MTAFDVLTVGPIYLKEVQYESQANTHGTNCSASLIPSITPTQKSKLKTKVFFFILYVYKIYHDD